MLPVANLLSQEKTAMNQDEILTLDQKQPKIAIQYVEKELGLANFTSTVVEDLQAPLRSLTKFTELLAQEYQDELDQKGQFYLDRISANGLQMQTLVEDLLTYSRTGTGEQTWITVDLNQTLILVQSELQSAIAESNATITIQNLPRLLLNPQDIYQLFKELLANAIKFGGDNPQIKILSVMRGEEWLFTIKDDGIGIAPEFHSRIFGVFQKLHSADIYSGNGIGLAICQKIINRYGGKIWVESKLDRGAKFCFTLPTSNK